ncbi:MAG TPA: RDD family protein [Candidatus Aquabacterium excrementipullorum]|nr:RDD family protein [Candidatus Aquabacterium excrementipullorum]
MPTPVYAGFWLRFAAVLIDTAWLSLLIYPLLIVLIGPEVLQPHVPYSPLRVLLEWVFPIVAIITFWVFRSATPGKMFFKLKVVDAQTFGPVPVPRLLLRYAGYYVAAIPFCMGLLWAALDDRKQGWHDKLAGTVVIRTDASAAPQPAETTAPATSPDDNAWPT